jgi:hypothetical protein
LENEHDEDMWVKARHGPDSCGLRRLNFTDVESSGYHQGICTGWQTWC